MDWTHLSQGYDGDGLRVTRSEDSTYQAVYLRSSVLGGQIIAEVDNVGGTWTWARGYVYSGSQLLAVQEGGVFFVHEDPVTKSKRVTDISGVVQSAVELDPYGADTSRSSNSAFQPRKFTSYERDGNGTDEAMMRRYNRYHSRFDQPDPYDGSYNLTDPQSLNRYAYVSGDPVNLIDPTGMGQLCLPGYGCWDDGMPDPTVHGGDGSSLNGGGGGGGGGYHPPLVGIGNDGGDGTGGGDGPPPAPPTQKKNPNEKLAECYQFYLSTVRQVQSSNSASSWFLWSTEKLSPVSTTGLITGLTGAVAGIMSRGQTGVLFGATVIQGPREGIVTAGSRGFARSTVGALGAVSVGASLGSLGVQIEGKFIGLDAWLRDKIRNCNKENPGANGQVDPGYLSDNAGAAQAYVDQHLP